MDLDIYEPHLGGGHSWGFPALTIGDISLYFNVLCVPAFSKSHKFTFSRDRISGDFYVGFLPEMSNARGFRVCFQGHSRALTSKCAKGVHKKWPDLQNGNYRVDLDNPVFHNDVDWFLIEPITE